MRSRINVFDHNKKIENRIKSREAIIKEEFGGKSGEALVKEINKRMAMEYILDSDFKKKYIRVRKGHYYTWFKIHEKMLLINTLL